MRYFNNCSWLIKKKISGTRLSFCTAKPDKQNVWLAYGCKNLANVFPNIQYRPHD
jgi:hypothetical protein